MTLPKTLRTRRNYTRPPVGYITMSAARSRPSEAQWLTHKPFIREEYLFKDVPLKTLVETLATRGLQITYGRPRNSEYEINANLLAARRSWSTDSKSGGFRRTSTSSYGSTSSARLSVVRAKERKAKLYSAVSESKGLKS
jgi:hypothetical protein